MTEPQETAEEEGGGREKGEEEGERKTERYEGGSENGDRSSETDRCGRSIPRRRPGRSSRRWNRDIADTGCTS